MKIYQKILKNFSNKATAEEQAQIESWKKESEANLKALEDLTALHQTAEKLKDFTPVDKDAAWENIRSKAGIEESKVFRLPSWVTSAAAVLVLVSVAIYFFETNNKPNLDISQIYTNIDQTTLHQLTDGTNVTLDKNSTLEVVEERYVSLRGRASFDVTTTPKKDNFRIKLQGGKITVLGTKFSVLSTDDLLEVAVEEGHVKLDYEGRSMDLYANDLVRLYNDQLAITKDNYNNTNSWLSNELVFKDEPLTQVLADLSRYFKVKIVLDKSIQHLGQCPLTSKYDNPTIPEIIDELKTIFEAKIIKQANSYVIVSINCDQ